MKNLNVELAIINYLEENREFLNISKEKEIDDKTLLFGANGFLDSIGLVHLVVYLEKYIQTHSANRVTLSSSHAMSNSRSPFKNVETLALFVKSKL